MIKLKNTLSSLQAHLTRVGRAKARHELLQLNDRTLEDAGFSRELLRQGVGAWPWRQDTDELPPLNFESLDALQGGARAESSSPHPSNDAVEPAPVDSGLGVYSSDRNASGQLIQPRRAA